MLAAAIGSIRSVPTHTYSQEFDLISPDAGKLTWLTGASYFYRSTPVTLNQYPYGAPVEPNAADANTAVNIGTHVHLVGLFGQVGYQIQPSLQLQVGARVSADGETSSGAITIPGPGIVISNVGNVFQVGSHRESELELDADGRPVRLWLRCPRLQGRRHQQCRQRLRARVRQRL